MVYLISKIKTYFWHICTHIYTQSKSSLDKVKRQHKVFVLRAWVVLLLGFWNGTHIHFHVRIPSIVGKANKSSQVPFACIVVFRTTLLRLVPVLYAYAMAYIIMYMCMLF